MTTETTTLPESQLPKTGKYVQALAEIDRLQKEVTYAVMLIETKNELIDLQREQIASLKNLPQ